MATVPVRVRSAVASDRPAYQAFLLLDGTRP